MVIPSLASQSVFGFLTHTIRKVDSVPRILAGHVMLTLALVCINSVSLAQDTAPFTETLAQMQSRDRAASNGGNVRQGTRKLPPRRRMANSRAPGQTSVFADAKQSRAVSSRAPQQIGAGFDTLNSDDSAFIPPDTMGAVGPNHFVELINGDMAVYTKTGTRLSLVTQDSFFTVMSGGITYPQNGSFDPRIIYDRRSGHWFASSLETGSDANNPSNNQVLLAVSRTSDPTFTWDKYVIFIGEPNVFSDFDTLGADDNGVYFGVTIFPSSNPSTFGKIAATPKASLIAASPFLGTVTFVSNITDMSSTPQAATNHDSVAANAPAWFVSSSATTFGGVSYRTVTWSGLGVPTLAAASTTVTTPTYGPPPAAPANGSIHNIDNGDDRILMAMIRNKQLWTCRNVGVNSSGTGSISSADRTACEWLELDVSTSSAKLTQSGRVFDPAPAVNSPRSYYYPAIMVNGQGHAALAFSGSSANEFVGAFTCGRLATDPVGTMESIGTLKVGQASYEALDNNNINRWGDYSFSSLDPNDDMTIWTIQEYASNVSQNAWGTWTTPLLSPAPMLNNPNTGALIGTTGVNLALSGTNFYDPGAGFNRLSVTLSGNFISNYKVTFNSPTSVNVTFDISNAATTGPRDITLTNPDGQSVTSTGAFTIFGPLNNFLVESAGGGNIPAQTTNVPFNIKLTARDASNFTVTTFTGTADISSTGTLSAGSVTTPNFSAGVLASQSVTISNAGNFTLTATHTGNIESGTSNTFTVLPSTNTAISALPSPSVFGQSVTFSATVSGGNGTPTGTVQFQIDGANFGTVTLAGGNASSGNTATLSTGNHTIGGIYSGDSNNAGSTGTFTQTVNPDASSTNLTSTPNSSVFGQSLMLTAAVSITAPGTSTPTGTVTFMDGSTFLGSSTLNSGSAALSTAALGTGAHNLSAVYGGDNNVAGSTGTLSQSVSQAATAATLAVSVNPSVAFQPVSFTAAVGASAPGAGTPTGTVTFKDGTATLGNGTLVSGSATFTGGFSLGTHSISAVYGGDANFTGSTTAAITQTVNQAGSTVVLSSSANPSTPTQGVVFTATVNAASPSTGAPSGSVQFQVDGVNLGAPVGLSGGNNNTASSSASTFPLGAHNVAAVYAGDSNFGGSSGNLTQTVNLLASSVALVSSTNPSAQNQGVTFTATVSAGSPIIFTPSGSVQFQIDGQNFGTPVVLSGGNNSAISASTSTLPLGTQNVVAVYAGDGNFSGSSANLTQTVNPLPVITSPLSASGMLGASFSYTIIATNNPISFNASGLPPGLSVNTATGRISGTPTQIGTTSVVISATTTTATTTATLSLAVSSAPAQFSSPPASSSPEALPGSLLTFTAPVGPGVTVSWNFGDGTVDNSNSSTLTHTFTAVGTYSVVVTATDSNGVSTSSVIPITIVGSQAEIDSDGNGFPDQLKSALGVSLTDPNATPFGIPGPVKPQALGPLKVAIKLNFARANSDSISVSGTLPVPVGFNSAGTSAAVDVGGVIQSFLLNMRGRGSKGGDTLSVTIPKKGGNGKFQAKFNRSTYSGILADSGLTGTENVSNQHLTMVIYIIFNQTLYKTTQPLTYQAKSGRTGSAK